MQRPWLDADSSQKNKVSSLRYKNCFMTHSAWWATQSFIYVTAIGGFVFQSSKIAVWFLIILTISVAKSIHAGLFPFYFMKDFSWVDWVRLEHSTKLWQRLLSLSSSCFVSKQNRPRIYWDLGILYIVIYRLTDYYLSRTSAIYTLTVLTNLPISST